MLALVHTSRAAANGRLPSPHGLLPTKRAPTACLDSSELGRLDTRADAVQTLERVSRMRRGRSRPCEPGLGSDGTDAGELVGDTSLGVWTDLLEICRTESHYTGCLTGDRGTRGDRGLRDLELRKGGVERGKGVGGQRWRRGHRWHETASSARPSRRPPHAHHPSPPGRISHHSPRATLDRLNSFPSLAVISTPEVRLRRPLHLSPIPARSASPSSLLACPPTAFDHVGPQTVAVLPAPSRATRTCCA